MRRRGRFTRNPVLAGDRGHPHVSGSVLAIRAISQLAEKGFSLGSRTLWILVPENAACLYGVV